MPIQLKEENEGNLLIVHVVGKLAKKDYERFVPEFERLCTFAREVEPFIRYDRVPRLDRRSDVGGH